MGNVHQKAVAPLERDRTPSTLGCALRSSDEHNSTVPQGSSFHHPILQQVVKLLPISLGLKFVNLLIGDVNLKGDYISVSDFTLVLRIHEHNCARFDFLGEDVKLAYQAGENIVFVTS